MSRSALWRACFLAEQVLAERQRHQTLCIRERFAGAGDFGAVGFAGLWADLRRPLPRSVLRCDLIHADMAAELALVSSGMTIPLSCAIFSANNICAGLAGLEPSSPGVFVVGFLGRVLVQECAADRS